MAAAVKDTAQMCNPVYNTQARRDVIATYFPVKLQKFGNRQRKEWHPDKDAYYIVAAKMLEAGSRPIKEEHPCDRYSINQNCKNRGFPNRDFEILAVNEIEQQNRYKPCYKENKIESMVNAVIYCPMYQLAYQKLSPLLQRTEEVSQLLFSALLLLLSSLFRL